MVTDCTDFRQNMGAEDHRVLLPQPFDQIPDLNDLLGIQSHCRLIQDDDLRITQKRLGKTGSLPIPLRQVADQAPRHLRHPGGFHGLRHKPLPVFFLQFLQLSGKIQILPDRHIRIQRGNLRKITDALLCFLRLLKDIVTVDDHLSAVSREITGDDIHGRGFPGTVGSEKSVYFPRLYRQ